MRIERILKDKGAAVVTVSPQAKVRDAVAVLSSKRIGAVVVANGDRKPLGILSERDVVHQIGQRGETCLGDPVHSMMTPDPKCAAPDEELDEILATMTTGRFRHMPVVENGVMVGLVSIGDVVKARLGELAAERDHLETMVTGA